MYVNPGELNKKIAILKMSSESDDDGFPTGKPVIIRRCYAKYSRKTADKEVEGADVEPEMKAVTRFLIRYTSAVIRTNMKVQYRNRLYDIEDINDIGDRHEYIELYCKEGAVKWQHLN